MKVGLIRHGKTEWNALGKIQGQTDTPLNEEGVRQAKALAARLARDAEKWDAIASSDLMRARQTAQIIADTLQIPLWPGDERLRERYFGAVEGTTEKERLERWGSNWRQVDNGQETDEAVRVRAISFIEATAAEQPDIRLLIVSHGSLLAQLLRAMCNELEDKPVTNMSFSILEQFSGGWKPLLHNCTLHLEQPIK